MLHAALSYMAVARYEPGMSSLPLVVIYEDRTTAAPGVELLVRSLALHSPSLAIAIFSPLEDMARLASEFDQVRWIATHDLVGRGWNAKPVILARGLELSERVLWLDSDVIMIGDIIPHLARYDADSFVVGQEFLDRAEKRSVVRAEGFGFNVARSIPYAVNSGSIVAGRGHLLLLKAWLDLLQRPDYLAAQQQPVAQRPVAFVGDQDALWALLVSDRFADIPVDYFRVGRDMILHCGANGYHVRTRLRHVLSCRAAFVHMLGKYKPWSFTAPVSLKGGRDRYLNQMCFELSPYFEAAQSFRGKLGNPEWLRRNTLAARILHRLFLGHRALQGMPPALMGLLAEKLGRRGSV